LSAANTLGQSWPSGLMAPNPVTTTRFIRPCPR
jgi:hypothetical protein